MSIKTSTHVRIGDAPAAAHAAKAGGVGIGREPEEDVASSPPSRDAQFLISLMDAMQQQLNKERLADATGWSVASLLDSFFLCEREFY